MFDLNSMIGLLIGGLLAAGTGWFIDYRRELRKEKKMRALLAQGIINDLKFSQNAFDELYKNYRESNIIWFNIISRIKESRHVYEQNKNFIILFDEKLYNVIFDYYTKTANVLLLLENIQTRRQRIQELAKQTDPTSDSDVNIQELKNIEILIPNIFNELKDEEKKIPDLKVALQNYLN